MTPPASIPVTVRLTPCEVAELMAQRDRARALVIRMEAICIERERLLWMAIGSTNYLEEARVERLIAAHLREHGSVPPSLAAES